MSAPIVHLPTFLPGRLTIAPGTRQDYLDLERFHYLPGRPATYAAIWAIRYFDCGSPHCGLRIADCGLGEEEDADNAFRTETLWPAQTTDSGPRTTDNASRLVAVGVLSYPVPCRRARERHFGLVGASFADRLHFANANLRTISRVIVHPQFRAIGLASRLVRHMCRHSPTRYTEASAKMGAVHPFFQRGGMQRLTPGSIDEPAYFLYDREADSAADDGPRRCSGQAPRRCSGQADERRSDTEVLTQSR